MNINIQQVFGMNGGYPVESLLNRILFYWKFKNKSYSNTILIIFCIIIHCSHHHSAKKQIIIYRCTCRQNYSKSKSKCTVIE